MHKKRILQCLLALILLNLLLIFAQSFRPVTAQTPTPSVSAALPSIVPLSGNTTPPPTESPTPSLSPSPSPTPRTDTASIKIVVGTQSPWNKRIPVTIYVTPHVSAARMEVSWQKKAGLVATPVTTSFANVVAESTYTVNLTITPQGIGYQRAIAQVILSTATQNFVSSEQIELNLDKDKIIQPQTAEYTAYLIGMYVSIGVVFLLVIPFALFKFGVYMKTTVFPKWYEKTIQSPR